MLLSSLFATKTVTPTSQSKVYKAHGELFVTSPASYFALVEVICATI